MFGKTDQIISNRKIVNTVLSILFVNTIVLITHYFLHYAEVDIERYNEVISQVEKDEKLLLPEFKKIIKDNIITVDEYREFEQHYKYTFLKNKIRNLTYDIKEHEKDLDMQ